MKSSKDYIGSGILELYVLGETTPEESQEIAELAAIDPLFQKQITELELALERHAIANAIEPDPSVRVFTLAAIDFSNRMQQGEQPSITPLLNESSKIADYAEWLDREDMVLPENFASAYAKILTYTPELTCALVWMKGTVTQEVHDDELEKFLVVEGSCLLTVGEEVYELVAGDYFEVPLHKVHHAVITSDIPCKVILQRIPA